MDDIVSKAIFTAKCIKENKTIWNFVINMKSLKLLLEHKMKNPKKKLWIESVCLH